VEVSRRLKGEEFHHSDSGSGGGSVVFVDQSAEAIATLDSAVLELR
jgi:hypothetical protein